MADEVEMKPVAARPQTATLKPGLKLPPKPGATVVLKPGLKLPPRPGATVGLKPGLKLPPKPGATVGLKPGLKLPSKPVINKPGATVNAAPIPKPLATAAPEVKPVETAQPAAAPEAKPVEAVQPAVAPEVKPVEAVQPAVAAAPTIVKPVIRKPGSTITAAPLPKPVMPVQPAATAPVQPAPATPAKPVSVDAQGIGKLPTVEAQAVSRADTKPTTADIPKPMEALKSVTQKLKGITQEIPQQAILRKTGILADGAMSDSQKEAAKHKTARISLSDAMGVAPVKNENAPMKTIRIKRPIDIPGATKPLAPQPPAAAPAAEASAPAEAPAQTATITQRKTLKITRPGGAVRPAGKFGIKRPGATAAPSAPSAPAAAVAPAGDVADIADIPDIPTLAPTAPVVASSDGPAWLCTLSVLVQVAACVVLGALAWFLYQNTQTAYF